MNIYKSFCLTKWQFCHLEHFPLSLASILYQDDLSVSQIMPAVGENLINPPLNRWHFNYCLLMRYYLYCTDNNHDLDVGLMYFNVVQFDCAHLNYTWCVHSIIVLGSLNINDDTADSNIIYNRTWPVFSLCIAVSSIILSIAGFEWGSLHGNSVVYLNEDAFSQRIS